MNPKARRTTQSAPECQLSKVGTVKSYGILLEAAEKLSEFELAALEKDLEYYDQTGLIGVHMSRLLVLLKPATPGIAA